MHELDEDRVKVIVHDYINGKLKNLVDSSMCEERRKVMTGQMRTLRQMLWAVIMLELTVIGVLVSARIF
jgi:hypothetical protein